MNQLNPYAKAIVGGVGAAAGTFAGIALDGHVTARDWAIVLGAMCASFLMTWATPNTPATPQE